MRDTGWELGNVRPADSPTDCTTHGKHRMHFFAERSSARSCYFVLSRLIDYYWKMWLEQ